MNTTTLDLDDIERAVLTVLEELLDGDEVVPDSDFFEIGGDSILAARAVARLRRILPVPIAVRDLFTARTPRALALVLPDRGHRR